MKIIIGIFFIMFFYTSSAQEAQIKYFPKVDTLITDVVRRDSISLLRTWIDDLKILVDSMDALDDSLLVYNYSQFNNFITMGQLLVGTVKFYNENKGYGFVIVDGSNDEYFIHASKLKDSITKGDIIKFEAVETKKGKQAFNVRLA